MNRQKLNVFERTFAMKIYWILNTLYPKFWQRKKTSVSNDTHETNSKYLFQVFLFYHYIHPKFWQREETSIWKDPQAIIRRTQIANIRIKYFFFIIVSKVLGERENLCKKGPASNNTQQTKSKYLFQVFLRIIAVSKVLAKREKTSVRKDL